MTTSEKVAYLKGLVEGFGIDGATKEGKILSNILDILEDLALDVEDMGANVAEMEEGLDVVSEDLEDVEDIVYDDEDEDEDEDDDEDEDEDGDDENEDESVFYEVECPNCGETVTFDEDVLNNGSMKCPACGETLEFNTKELDESKSEGKNEE
jgi:hypothetical protein